MKLSRQTTSDTAFSCHSRSYSWGRYHYFIIENAPMAELIAIDELLKKAGWPNDQCPGYEEYSKPGGSGYSCGYHIELDSVNDFKSDYKRLKREIRSFIAAKEAEENLLTSEDQSEIESKNNAQTPCPVVHKSLSVTTSHTLHLPLSTVTTIAADNQSADSSTETATMELSVDNNNNNRQSLSTGCCKPQESTNSSSCSVNSIPFDCDKFPSTRPLPNASVHVWNETRHYLGTGKAIETEKSGVLLLVAGKRYDSNFVLYWRPVRELPAGQCSVSTRQPPD